MKEGVYKKFRCPKCQFEFSFWVEEPEEFKKIKEAISELRKLR